MTMSWLHDYNTNHSSDKDEMLIPLNIFDLDLEKHNNLDLINKQILVLESISLGNLEGMIEKLEWIAKVCIFFSEKIDEPVGTNIHNTLHTSSYNFCTWKHKCRFNYRPMSDGCYSDHFVHHVLHDDIISVVNCIKHHLGGDEEEEKEESQIEDFDIIKIERILKTFKYVLEHMYNELYETKKYIINKQYRVKKKNQENNW